jgi:hypothetical protein
MEWTGTVGDFTLFGGGPPAIPGNRVVQSQVERRVRELSVIENRNVAGLQCCETLAEIDLCRRQELRDIVPLFESPLT